MTKPGLYCDGDGLYLQVTPGGKSWIFRYMRNGHARKVGLGPLRDVGLANARGKARDLRTTLRAGLDPLAERNARAVAIRLAEASTILFTDCARIYIAAHAAGWRNAKHREQWTTTLATHAEPILGRLPVQDIDTSLLMRVLEPIWATKTETATRIRQRIEAILDWATVRGYRSGENPARWKGHLDKLLPAPRKVKRVRHYPALPFAEINAFVIALRDQVGTAARALEFTILTATRTGEVIGARWSEIDLSAETWTIPGERMKAGRPHTVPLSSPSLKILDEQRVYASQWVFPGQRSNDRATSSMAMLMTLRRMNRCDLTVDGFRSTFRDWCSEQTAYPHEVCEMALAHAIRNQAEAAYRRGDLLDKRRRLMTDWSKYIDKPQTAAATVTWIRTRG